MNVERERKRKSGKNGETERVRDQRERSEKGQREKDVDLVGRHPFCVLKQTKTKKNNKCQIFEDWKGDILKTIHLDEEKK